MIPVIDVFAGPGGLNEGFASVVRGGRPSFTVVASFEMESNAVQTLTLRTALRDLGGSSDLYEPYRRALSKGEHPLVLRTEPAFERAWRRASQHVHQLTLGEANRDDVAGRIRQALGNAREWVLIGGPPCQAYSLVGRSRRTKDPTFADDHKHLLYREYLDILTRFEPSIFVMENVKGLLSAGHQGSPMFDRILRDLRQDGKYRISSLVSTEGVPSPSDYVIRAERYGIPQRRHRIILLGIRSDLGIENVQALTRRAEQTVRDAIRGLPALVPGVTKTPNPEAARRRAAEVGLQLAAHDRRDAKRVVSTRPGPERLRDWLTQAGVAISQHEPRAHMEGDLARYRYLAEMAEYGLTPRVQALPRELSPAHKNLKGENTPFIDRFKVQSWDSPSSTVASHIAKDGHYYIHPDPQQMRSLSVREAARLQTFPDDYFFWGPRTAQYHQVGNAVPPLLARDIAERVADLLGQ